MITLYLLLVGAGLGFETGYGAGISGELNRGPWTVYAQADLVDQDKVESPGHRWGALLELRYGRRVFGLVGARYSETRVEAFDKGGSSLLAGLGAQGGGVRGLLRYYFPDDTVNEAEGVDLVLEYLGSLYCRVTYGHFWFDDRSDGRVAVAVGWRF